MRTTGDTVFIDSIILIFKSGSCIQRNIRMGEMSSISIWFSNRERNAGLSFSNLFWQSEKISVKESCLYGIIDIRITPFLDDGF